MMRCEKCGVRARCKGCAGTGLVLTMGETPVWASCAECWGTGLQHDPTRHERVA